MDQQKLAQLKETVTRAEGLKDKIETLKEVIASCNAEVGFMNVTVNYAQQNEIKLARNFGAKEVFPWYKGAVKGAAEKHLLQLEEEFKNLDIEGK